MVGGIEYNVVCKIKYVWMKYITLVTGAIQSDKMMPFTEKRKLYKTLVKPARGGDDVWKYVCWAVNKKIDGKKTVKEMKMNTIR